MLIIWTLVEVFSPNKQLPRPIKVDTHFPTNKYSQKIVFSFFFNNIKSDPCFLSLNLIRAKLESFFFLKESEYEDSLCDPKKKKLIFEGHR